MQYLGSKSRIAKEILPLILADRKEGQYFLAYDEAAPVICDSSIPFFVSASLAYADV